MKTEFDLCLAAKPLQERLWFSRGDPAFWSILQACSPRIHLFPPASDEQIRALRDFAGGDLPPTLEDFLRQSNGLMFDCDHIVLPSEGIIEETVKMRQLETTLPNDHFLYIGSLGDGDMFAFIKNKAGEWLSDVFGWEHETDSSYACGLGIWGYVANHVGRRHAVWDQPPEDPSIRGEAEYRERLRKLSGENDVIPGLQRLVTNILDMRARQDFGEITCVNLLIEFLAHLTIADFRKIPIERLLLKGKDD